MAKLSSGFPIDVAYGSTPEKAILSLLLKHPEYTTEDPEYLGERPTFADVDAAAFQTHDWEQYDRGETGGDGQRDPITVKTRGAVDPLGDGVEAQKRLLLTNVWLNVGHVESGRRDKLNVMISTQLRERAWSGDDGPRNGELIWRCERITSRIIE